VPNVSPWSESAAPGVKYFSGTANYRRTLTAPSEWFTFTGPTRPCCLQACWGRRQSSGSRPNR
jgi:hypothetical protein